MLYKQTTQTPNVLFDVLLKSLSRSELTVLLTIIRKTIGMVNPFNTNQRLERAWISQRLFSICTGLSGRSVSNAIDSLVRQHLITVTNRQGHHLKTRASRRGVFKLYYSSSLLLEQNQEKRKSSEVTCLNPVTNGHTIKLTETKLLCEQRSQGFKKIQRISDRERILQILHQQKKK
ncbi:MAG: hypothetical protein PSN34_03415 [Urechidicola sp.]|nr:hypothetical protein [Urechidicola sp.]